LVAEGKSIILITHKLKEILKIADTVTIIRRGKHIETIAKSATNPDQLAEKMVGRQVSFHLGKKKSEPGEIILDVRDLQVKGRHGLKGLNGTSFVLRRGEILGIAGVDGNGQTELIEALSGLLKVDSGSIQLLGKDITNQSVRSIAESGMSHIPEDRHKHGLILDFTLSENMVLSTYYRPKYNKNGFLDYKAIDKHAEDLVSEFDVRTPNIFVTAGSLSGGNQQKAIIARELSDYPEFLIAAQPTRGLDVGAIEFIHQRLIEQRNMNKAVLLISYELEEIMQLSDRIAVLYEGQVVGEVFPEKTNDQELGCMMAGTKITEGGRIRG
jgi:ABC-type uncharacterized transport system ATPase subunit